MAPKQLHVPILYGSQTGNSQGCAESLAESLPSTIKKSISASVVRITSSAKTLDDFLEMDRAKWPRLVIIICSSYGVGQAPIGCWKFRDLCDSILEDDQHVSKLKGVTYAMMGLGDSKYTTFFLNPTALDSALSKAGAERIGSLGKADASGEGEKLQSKVMAKWCDDIIFDVLRFVKSYVEEGENEKNAVDEALVKAQDETCKICKKIFDDWEELGSSEQSKSSLTNLPLIIVVALLAVFLATTLNKQ